MLVLDDRNRIGARLGPARSEVLGELRGVERRELKARKLLAIEPVVAYADNECTERSQAITT